MNTYLRILLISQVLVRVTMQTKAGTGFTGTEGGSVEIRCSYPDSYQYVNKYFCRDPCGNSDVLIETQRADEVFSKDRYSILNSVNSQSFSVTIRPLRLSDRGVYYCGVDMWGKDELTRVHVSVRNYKSTTTTKQDQLSTTTKPTHSSAHENPIKDDPTSPQTTPATQTDSLNVLVRVTMQTKAGTGFTGTEGGSVEIRCSYPDSYQYVNKYFCRDPCGNSDVLIETQRVDEVFSKGRYSILNAVNSLSFSVTISPLRLSDRGVYYCGVDMWGKDELTRVHVSVRSYKSTTTTKQDQLSTTTEPTHSSSHEHSSALISSQTTPTTGKDSSTFLENSRTDEPTSSQTSPATQTDHLMELTVSGGMLGLLLCSILVIFVVLYRKPSNTQNSSFKASVRENQASDPPPSIHHQMMAVYSLAGPLVQEVSSETYTVVEYTSSSETSSLIQHTPPSETFTHIQYTPYV